jgi:hypothetical protein
VLVTRLQSDNKHSIARRKAITLSRNHNFMIDQKFLNHVTFSETDLFRKSLR